MNWARAVFRSRFCWTTKQTSCSRDEKDFQINVASWPIIFGQDFWHEIEQKPSEKRKSPSQMGRRHSAVPTEPAGTQPLTLCRPLRNHQRGSLVTTSCATGSCLSLQKKGKNNFASSASTQRGIATRDATYQTLERTKEPITKALPWNDKARCLHDARIFSTAVIRSRQLASSRSPGSA